MGFLNGLNERVKDELTLGDEVDSFHSLMTLDIRLDNQKWEQNGRGPAGPATS